MKHKIKISKEEFKDISSGKKTFYVSSTRENFELGDKIVFKEHEHTTGRCTACEYSLPDESCTCGSLDAATGNKIKCEVIYKESTRDDVILSIKNKNN
jgi:hypothetical protein